MMLLFAARIAAWFNAHASSVMSLKLKFLPIYFVPSFSAKACSEHFRMQLRMAAFDAHRPTNIIDYFMPGCTPLVNCRTSVAYFRTSIDKMQAIFR